MKLLGIDITKGYVGCFGSKILGFGAGLTLLSGLEAEPREGNVLLLNPLLYNIAGAWNGRITIPLVSNFCIATRQPIINRVWNNDLKRQDMNVDLFFKIPPTISLNALTEYLGAGSPLSSLANNNPLSKLTGLEIDTNNIQNPFLLLVSTMLKKRQRTAITYMNIGDTYYAWQVVTPNIIEKDLFLTNYTVDYQTGDITLNLTNYVAPSIRGQAEPYLYTSVVAGTGF